MARPRHRESTEHDKVPALGWSIALSVGVSIAVGPVSGICPATLAAAVDSIEALRYE